MYLRTPVAADREPPGDVLPEVAEGMADPLVATVSPPRSSPPPPRACFRHGSAGTARIAGCGADAGPGGERSRGRAATGPAVTDPSRSLYIPSGTGSRVGHMAGPLGNRPCVWACGPSRRRGTGPALPPSHAPGQVPAGDLSAGSSRRSASPPSRRPAAPSPPPDPRAIAPPGAPVPDRVWTRPGGSGPHHSDLPPPLQGEPATRYRSGAPRAAWPTPRAGGRRAAGTGRGGGDTETCFGLPTFR
jgi:hypothetical protein